MKFGKQTMYQNVQTNSLALIALGIFLAATQTGCDNLGSKSDEADGLPEKAKVKVVVVKTDTLNEKVTIPVMVESYEMTALYSRVEGYVGKVNVDIGDEVSGPKLDVDGKLLAPGDALVVLDVPELVSERVRRENLVDKAEADERSVKEAATSMVKQVDQAKSRRATQHELIELKTFERDRIARIVRAGDLRREEQEKAQYALDVANEQLKEVDADIAAVQARKLSADAKADAATADIAVAEAELRKAQDMERYSVIRAPFDGLITERNIHPGALVRSDDDKPLITIENVNKLRLIMYLPYDHATKLDVGDPVLLHTVEGRSDESFPEMTVTRSAESFHRGSRTMRAETDYDNRWKDPETSRRKLMPGDYGRVTITLKKYEQVATVPASALIENYDRTYVMIVEGGKCQRIRVDVVVTDGTKVGIKGQNGVSLLGKQVIIADIARFKDGQTIDSEVEVVGSP